MPLFIIFVLFKHVCSGCLTGYGLPDGYFYPRGYGYGYNFIPASGYGYCSGYDFYSRVRVWNGNTRRVDTAAGGGGILAAWLMTVVAHRSGERRRAMGCLWPASNDARVAQGSRPRRGASRVVG